MIRRSATFLPLAAATPPSRPPVDPRVSYGIDCACYFSESLYVRSPVEGHFTFVDAARFRREHTELLDSLGEPAADALIANLEAEVERRQSLPAQAAQRKARIAAEYVPLHPELWSLSEEWLHPELIALVRGAQQQAAPSSSAWRPPALITEGVYTLPVFTARFCELMCEELEAFGRSGLPCGRPNSMNRYGALLDEMGFTSGLIEPLIREWLRPLAAMLPPLAAVGGGSLDHHKAFVVAYRLGEDEHLAEHYDNAEVTLNVNLGRGFAGGELVFYGHKRSASSSPRAAHDWDAGAGHGVLHLGAQVHAALPISEGERYNLVIWMRSWSHRRRRGCPMCDATDRLLLPPQAQPEAGQPVGGDERG